MHLTAYTGTYWHIKWYRRRVKFICLNKTSYVANTLFHLTHAYTAATLQATALSSPSAAAVTAFDAAGSSCIFAFYFRYTSTQLLSWQAKTRKTWANNKMIAWIVAVLLALPLLLLLLLPAMHFFRFINFLQSAFITRFSVFCFVFCFLLFFAFCPISTPCNCYYLLATLLEIALVAHKLLLPLVLFSPFSLHQASVHCLF